MEVLQAVEINQVAGGNALVNRYTVSMTAAGLISATIFYNITEEWGPALIMSSIFALAAFPAAGLTDADFINAWTEAFIEPHL